MHRTHRSRTGPRRLVATATAALLAGAGALAPTAALAQEPADEAAEAAEHAVSWAAIGFARDGGALSFDGSTIDPGASIDALLGMAAAGREDVALGILVASADGLLLDAIIDYLEPEATPIGGVAGRVGKWALLQAAIGPVSEGERELDAGAINATLRGTGDPEEGLFLEDDGTFNGFAQTFQQSLAVLGLVALDQAIPDAAVAWLLAQQCTSGPNAGGFANRSADERAADDDGSCDDQLAGQDTPDDATDDQFISPPGIDTTGIAVQAILAADPLDDGLAAQVDDAVDAALAWLVTQQDPNGGFGASGFLAEGEQLGGRTNANSTALAVQAIVAAGEDPTAPGSRWVQDGGDPVSTLARTQLGCEVDPLDRGALPFPFFGIPADQPSAFATFQGMWGLGLRPFPLVAPDEPDVRPGRFEDCGLVEVRAAGEDRYATSYALAREAFPDGTDTLLVATGRDFADGVVAGPLAVELDAALVLADGDVASDALLALVDDLGVRRVLLLGGPAALSEAFATSLAEGAGLAEDGLERVAGEDRFDTAVAVLTRIEQARADEAPEGEEPRPVDLVHVTKGIEEGTGSGFADALAVTQLGVPILLTRGGSLPEATAAAVADRAVGVVGGPEAVSDAVLAALDDVNGEPGVGRAHAGETRYGTAADIALTTFLTTPSPGRLWIATGERFPDALTAAAAAAVNADPFMIVPGSADELPDDALGAFIGPLVDELVVAGGAAAVGDGIVEAVVAALRLGAD